MKARSMAVLAVGVAALAGVAVAAEGAAAFRCDNACPLAKRANELRSFGGESAGPRAAALAAAVRRNLDRIQAVRRERGGRAAGPPTARSGDDERTHARSVPAGVRGEPGPGVPVPPPPDPQRRRRRRPRAGDVPRRLAEARPLRGSRFRGGLPPAHRVPRVPEPPREAGPTRAARARGRLAGWRSLPEPADPRPPESPDDAEARRFLLDRVHRVLDAMPGAQRDAFLLFRHEGMTCAAIAEVTETPVKTVETRVRRATAILAERLAPYRGYLPAVRP